MQTNRPNTGALIGGAILIAFGLLSLVGQVFRALNWGLLWPIIVMGGLAATFACVWLRHARDWAKVATIALAALAVVSVFFASYAEIFWPVAIILVGGYLLYNSLRPKMVR